MKHRFFDDYSEGAHPLILKALEEVNAVQDRGYGLDSITAEAVALIKRKLDNEQAAVHFVAGGTQANQIVLSSLLKPYEAVIAAGSGHINVHEAGAIEATGHKVVAIPSTDGKIAIDDIQKALDFHSDEHYVLPRVVYISNATELGTVYSKSELQALYSFCQCKGLKLFIDGARLGVALASGSSALLLKDLSKLADIFYIGGTKNGALLGEAIVINSPSLGENFRYHIKQRGGLMAKGRILGIQFKVLFEGDLWSSLARHSIEVARTISAGLEEMGVIFLAPSQTNQLFPIFDNSILERLKQNYGFYEWGKIDSNRTAIRLVTSWATPVSAAHAFLSDVRQALDHQTQLMR